MTLNHIKVVHLAGFEPAASTLGGERSIHLSYKCIVKYSLIIHYIFHYAIYILHFVFFFFKKRRQNRLLKIYMHLFAYSTLLIRLLIFWLNSTIRRFSSGQILVTRSTAIIKITTTA